MARTYGGVAPEQRRADRRQRLLVAGLELFTSTGFRHTKITEVCARAGVSTRNFYEEFTSKEDVLRTLHDQINSLALAHVTAELDKVADADALTRISKLLDVFIATVTVDPRMPRLNYVEAVGVSAELEAQHQVWVDRWANFIAAEANRAAEHGVVPVRDYRLTAIALVGAGTGLLREWQAHDPPLPVEQIGAEFRAMMLSAIMRPEKILDIEGNRGAAADVEQSSREGDPGGTRPT
ncbi:TetR/AcrR family transcriptional regulator [Amycolatopsis sp. WQ 127309]|uniref:TetR/AcrR family transcriptional regulator n=1 Tax=Amycolatopsis sp. WQ 127309 TaxID=2932773 RepID=UPI001FF21369|nr:TetR/AcrR family transcriptional regulator [Amycolatopsis sp. WQ 127309]UOZ08069.1 TetR/AcrR family transcriptional regulator [Amycolatopsis sp. WQ 127309]